MPETHHCPYCCKPVDLACIKKGHVVECEAHPGSYHSSRTGCPKCHGEDRREVSRSSKEAAEIWAAEQIKRKAEREEERVRVENEVRLRRYLEREARKAGFDVVKKG
jgi:hypothetical protein